MAVENFPVVSPAGNDKPRVTAAVLNSVRSGKLNNGFLGTLAANQGSTTFTAANTPGVEKVGPNSFIGWMALTANAAAEAAGPTMRVTARANGSVTIAHANNSQTDRDFQMIVFN
jgi:hypothetical protein